MPHFEQTEPAPLSASVVSGAETAQRDLDLTWQIHRPSELKRPGKAYLESERPSKTES